MKQFLVRMYIFLQEEELATVDVTGRAEQRHDVRIRERRWIFWMNRLQKELYHQLVPFLPVKVKEMKSAF